MASAISLLARLTLIFGMSSNALALVDVIQRVPRQTPLKCLALLDGDHEKTRDVSEFVLLKAGIRTSYGGKDQTDRPPSKLSEKQAIEVIFRDLDRVHTQFELMFRKMGWTETKIRDQISYFKKQDLLNHSLPLTSASTMYFASRNSIGDLVGFIRVVAVRGGNSGILPLEEKIKLNSGNGNGNRAELGRAFFIGGRYSEIVLREILQEVSKRLFDFYEGEDFEVYGLSNKSRARNYQRWGFSNHEVSADVGDSEKYLCTQNGKQFYDRYQGHLDRAKTEAFRNYPFHEPDKGLKILTDFESLPGMKDYLPNLILQSAIYASKQDYARALAISDYLKEIANPEAEANLDFNVLWRSRLELSPFQRPTGNPKLALKVIEEYLSTKPLDTRSYNYRANLFLVYQFQILLLLEDFQSAERLLLENKLFLAKAISIHKAVYDMNWEIARGVRVYLSSDPIALKQLEWALDLGTNWDGVAISALAPEAYFSIADQMRAHGAPEAEHFEKIGQWLSPVLKKLGLPVLGVAP